MDEAIQVEDALPPAKNMISICCVPDLATIKVEREDFLDDAINDTGNSAFFFNDHNEEERPIKIRKGDTSSREDPITTNHRTCYMTSSPYIPSFNSPVFVKVENEVRLENETFGAGITTDLSTSIEELIPRIKVEGVDEIAANTVSPDELSPIHARRITVETLNIKEEKDSSIKEEAVDVAVENNFTTPLSDGERSECSGESSQLVLLCDGTNERTALVGLVKDPCSSGEEREPFSELQTSKSDCGPNPANIVVAAKTRKPLCNNSSTVERPFLCPRCPAKFKIQDSLDIHLIVHAPKKLFPCKICSVKLRSKDEWNRHQVLHKKGMKIDEVREHFSVKFQKKDSLKRHMMNHNQLYLCIYCSAEFKTLHGFNLHTRLHLRQKVFSCPGCLTDFKTKKDLNSHLDKYMNNKKFLCTTDTELKTASYLNSFAVSQSTVKRPKCTSCCAEFKTMNDLMRHRNTHMINRVYPCTLCSTEFKTICDFNTHMATHVPAKLFSCGNCPAEFKTSSDLDRHKTISQNENVFLCSNCPLEFQSKCDLLNHQQVHMNDKLFSCTGCSAEFKTRYDLNIHLDMHLNEKQLKIESDIPANEKPFSNNLVKLENKNSKSTVVNKWPFSCPSCPATFRIKESLDVHSFIHSDQKPYACQKCTARFKWKHNWKQHQMTHIYSRPFACSHCPAKFRSQVTLDAHMLKHTDNKPYSCLFCPAKFRWKDEWENHQTIHTDNGG